MSCSFRFQQTLACGAVFSAEDLCFPYPSPLHSSKIRWLVCPYANHILLKTFSLGIVTKLLCFVAWTWVKSKGLAYCIEIMRITLKLLLLTWTYLYSIPTVYPKHQKHLRYWYMHMSVSHKKWIDFNGQYLFLYLMHYNPPPLLFFLFLQICMLEILSSKTKWKLSKQTASGIWTCCDFEPVQINSKIESVHLWFTVKIS